MARAKEATSGGGNGNNYLDMDGLDVHNLTKSP
jgi:hypothetical protein